MTTSQLHLDAPFASRPLQFLASLPRNLARRRAMKRLLDLDQKMLDDIGVTRDEVEFAAGLPLSVNAAVELNRMGLERRRLGL